MRVTPTASCECSCKSGCAVQPDISECSRRSGWAVQPDITDGSPSQIAFVGQVAQFNLTSEEEAYSFEGYVANIRDLGHGYPLALTP